jgi:predicted nucleotidyltransferase
MEAALERAAEQLARDPRVIALYVFGSVASGRARPGSDVDLAVLLDRPVSLAEELDLRAELARALGRGDVDLVLLREASPLLAYEVVTGGRRLHARDRDEADRFEEGSVRRYLDTAYLRAVQGRLLREAVR